jgi:hypothetical protein
MFLLKNSSPSARASCGGAEEAAKPVTPTTSAATAAAASVQGFEMRDALRERATPVR